MIFIERFLNAFLSLYDRFLLLRANPKKWREELDAIREWISGKTP